MKLSPNIAHIGSECVACGCCVLVCPKDAIHIAFGMNLSFGGTRDSNIHYDCIINAPTVWVDDVMILDKGNHIYENMK